MGLETDPQGGHLKAAELGRVPQLAGGAQGQPARLIYTHNKIYYYMQKSAPKEPIYLTKLKRRSKMIEQSLEREPTAK